LPLDKRAARGYTVPKERVIMDSTPSPEVINAIFEILKINAICQSAHTSRNSIFYDIFLQSELTLRKFNSQIKEIGFRLGSKFPPHLEIFPDKSAVRLQLLKNTISPFSWFEEFKPSKDEMILPMYLGHDYYDNPLHVDLARHPHTLISGITGSGKSVGLNGLIANTLFQPKVELYLGDPKTVEFSPYERLNNVVRIAYTYQDHLDMLDDLIVIMEQRFKLLKQINQVNMSGTPWMKKIVVIIDEIADLIYADKHNAFQDKLAKLAAKCRAAGIFLVIATQRPSVDIVSGAIKANFPARIACKVASKVDSKVILDQTGAENLIGNGDAIIRNHRLMFSRFRFSNVTSQQILDKAKELGKLNYL
jgi:S-DNA-T family DNA segregation ATPase FtsK/SpoIIIE